MNSRHVAVILALVVVGLVGAIIGLLRSEPEAHGPLSVGMIGALVGFLPSEPEMHGLPPPNPNAAMPVVAQNEQLAATAPNALPVPTVTADDRKIDEIIRLHPGNTGQDHASAAQLLIKLLPTLGKEAQVACAHHISNLIADKDYSCVMHIWRNPTTSRDVLEVFASDLMNRDNNVKLPALLDALRQPAHPFHKEAQNTLRLFVEGDFGNDFGKWDSALKTFLTRENEARQAANHGSQQATLPR